MTKLLIALSTLSLAAGLVAQCTVTSVQAGLGESSLCERRAEKLLLTNPELKGQLDKADCN